MGPVTGRGGGKRTRGWPAAHRVKCPFGPRQVPQRTRCGEQGCRVTQRPHFRTVPQRPGAELGWPIALEPPPEAGGPMPGGLGRVSPEECPLPTHLCPQLATHEAGMPGWEWGGPHVTPPPCRCARVNRREREPRFPATGRGLACTGLLGSEEGGGPRGRKWPGCPLTGFWGRAGSGEPGRERTGWQDRGGRGWSVPLGHSDHQQLMLCRGLTSILLLPPSLDPSLYPPPSPRVL